MKILVSSKGFYSYFKIIRGEQIKSVRIDGDKNFIVRTENNEISMNVESREKNEMHLQNNVRWDWLLRDIGSISEQPMVIEFAHQSAKYTLSYGNE